MALCASIDRALGAKFCTSFAKSRNVLPAIVAKNEGGRDGTLNGPRPFGAFAFQFRIQPFDCLRTSFIMVLRLTCGAQDRINF